MIFNRCECALKMRSNEIAVSTHTQIAQLQSRNAKQTLFKLLDMNMIWTAVGNIRNDDLIPVWFAKYSRPAASRSHVTD
jgi:hypothetical protein